jgi:hypothetical protein
MMSIGLASLHKCSCINIKTAADNKKNMKLVVDSWNLGPIKAFSDRTSNKPYWSKMAKIWNVPETEARHMLCANCEYFKNDVDTMSAMDIIPENEFDIDGGGRGYCKKFDFICHNLRTCQAWED